MSWITILLKFYRYSILYQISEEKIFWLPPTPKYRIVFITPTDSAEVSNIIFSVNQKKSDGPNSIPTKILKLLNKVVYDQLAIFFNKSFSSGIFSSILNINKIIPIYKKGSELECSNFRSIPLLSNIDKVQESWMFNRLYNFQKKKKKKKKEIIFSFQFGFQQKYSTTHEKINDLSSNQMLTADLPTIYIIEFERHLCTCAKRIFKIFSSYKMKENNKIFRECYKDHCNSLKWNLTGT